MAVLTGEYTAKNIGKNYRFLHVKSIETDLPFLKLILTNQIFSKFN